MKKSTFLIIGAFCLVIVGCSYNTNDHPANLSLQYTAESAASIAKLREDDREEKFSFSSNERESNLIEYKNDKLKLPNFKVKRVSYRNLIENVEDSEIAAEKIGRLICHIEEAQWMECWLLIEKNYDLEEGVDTADSVYIYAITEDENNFVLSLSYLSNGIVTLSTNLTPQNITDKKDYVLLFSYSEELLELIKEIAQYKEVQPNDLYESVKAEIYVNHGHGKQNETTSGRVLPMNDIKAIIQLLNEATPTVASHITPDYFIEITLKSGDVVCFANDTETNDRVALGSTVYYMGEKNYRLLNKILDKYT